jgi:tripartite-type tricarboxylate transporter receptor subunit TctC
VAAKIAKGGNPLTPNTLVLACAAGLFALSSLAASAQTTAQSTAQTSAPGWPSQPIRMIVPYAAGGITDVLGRLAAEHIKNKSGQTTVVENRAGAGGNTGLAMVASSAPDGHTIGLAAVTNLLVNPHIFKQMPFDAAKDLIPVAPIAEGPQLLVVPASLPARTLAEFVAWSKSNPDKMNFGSAGNGSPNHLSGDFVVRALGIKAAHLPYRGAALALTDLLSGSLQMMVIAPGALGGHVESGAVRALATVAEKRMPGYPGVPTLGELGFAPYDMSNWYGVVVPAATPRSAVEALNRLIVSMGDDPEIARKLAAMHVLPMRVSVDAFAASIKADAPKWASVVKNAGIQPE